MIEIFAVIATYIILSYIAEAFTYCVDMPFIHDLPPQYRYKSKVLNRLMWFPQFILLMMLLTFEIKDRKTAIVPLNHNEHRLHEESIMQEWNDLFCPKCEWNLKGIKPDRYCTHCDYEESDNRRNMIEWNVTNGYVSIEVVENNDTSPDDRKGIV